jgi:hypothetical protein
VSADPPDTARVHAVCFAARTISPDDPPAAARRQDMRSGCAGGARRASARARATSQRARRTSIRQAGMPHTLLAALLPLVRCSPVGCVFLKIQISFEFTPVDDTVTAIRNYQVPSTKYRDK